MDWGRRGGWHRANSSHPSLEETIPAGGPQCTHTARTGWTCWGPTPLRDPDLPSKTAQIQAQVEREGKEKVQGKQRRQTKLSLSSGRGRREDRNEQTGSPNMAHSPSPAQPKLASPQPVLAQGPWCPRRGVLWTLSPFTLRTKRRPEQDPAPGSNPARQPGQGSLWPRLLDLPSPASFCSSALARCSPPGWTLNPKTTAATTTTTTPSLGSQANCRSQKPSGHCQNSGSLLHPFPETTVVSTLSS